ncbi:MAG: alpha/beta fold hydrolase [Pseudomonadota bacterium]
MAAALIASATMAPAQSAAIPSAVIADPSPNAEHPAQLLQVRYPTGGVQVPARLFLAAGEGPHPTVLLLHGFPGTELNLDLARAIQRSGWNVMAIHYRGVWGAPGQFSFGHTIEDARAALTWLRDPSNAKRVDASRIVVLGHSMGGFDTVMIGDERVAGFVVISAANFSDWAAAADTPAKKAELVAELVKDASFTNASATSLADEILANAKVWDWPRHAAKMAGHPVLTISSDDGNEPYDRAVATAVEAAGGPVPTRIKFRTDHSYNDHRIALQAAVIDWLLATFAGVGTGAPRP